MKTLVSAVVIATMCVTASCTQSTDKKAGGQSITIAFNSSKGCTPQKSTASAGTFNINAKNSGNTTGELEVLDGNRVRGEVENLLPGAKKSFTIKLKEGKYKLLCGSQQAKKGVLTITKATTKAKALKVDKTKLAAATDAYKQYVVAESQLLETTTHTLTDAVRAGNLQAAQAAYGASRVPYETIEPVAELFAKYDAEIDSRVDDFDSVTDPNFTGFHRIEYGLFSLNSTDGLTPFADRLDKNVSELHDSLVTLTIDPLDMAKGAQGLIEEVAMSKITGEEDRYAHTDLYDFQANVDGAVKIIDLLRSLLDSVDPTLTKKFDTSIAQVNARLATYKHADGTWDSYEQISEADRTQFKADVGGLSELLSQVPGTLGLS